ncbi:MAG: nitroreductase family deazaflavin-dependent oxidoreductase [Catenulispora sp.]|nr:nitroreductase family deazaflavin-dependent oxidoreductase [Catenulispora sp.]
MSSNDEPRDWNEQIIEEFRANAGSVAQFGGKGLVLLHHTGAKSGTEYVSPLAGVPQPDGGWLIIASNAGRALNPAWFHNLRANPRTRIEVPGDDAVRTVEVTASVPGDAERDRLFAEVVARLPQFGEYQKGTSRKIPVVLLTPAS